MDNVILNTYSKINNLDVSRETCNELEKLITMIQEKNKQINIISRKIREKSEIRVRHILDSAQIIDFVDLNTNTTCDLGTGGGMPGLIVAIVMKKIKNSMKVSLYEKSHNKCDFLKEVSKKLNLNTEIIHKDIFTVKNIETGTIMSRAFKPMPVILDLVNSNFKNYKNIILFMGNSGKEILTQKSVNMSKIRDIWPEIIDHGSDIDEQIEINSHYRGYLKKQKADILAFKRDENLSIPDNIDYDQFSGLSNEVKSKFKQIKPKTMGQALRIDGITPAAVYILLSHVKRKSIKHIA